MVFYGKGNENHQFGKRVFFVQHRAVSEVRIGEFVSDRMSYIVLRCRLSDIIVSNVHAPSEDKSDNAIQKRVCMTNYSRYLTIFLSTI
jgi:hypothetical protein